MMEKNIYYHGSSVIFDSFNLDSLAESSGCKFGAGIYLTEAFDTAAHYSEPRNGTADHHYVYTVEVPDKTEENCLPYYGVPIPSIIISRVEERLGEILPDFIKGSGRVIDTDGENKGVSLGKFLRKYIKGRRYCLLSYRNSVLRISFGTLCREAQMGIKEDVKNG